MLTAYLQEEMKNTNGIVGGNIMKSRKDETVDRLELAWDWINCWNLVESSVSVNLWKNSVFLVKCYLHKSHRCTWFCLWQCHMGLHVQPRLSVLVPTHCPVLQVSSLACPALAETHAATVKICGTVFILCIQPWKQILPSCHILYDNWMQSLPHIDHNHE